MYQISKMEPTRIRHTEIDLKSRPGKPRMMGGSVSLATQTCIYQKSWGGRTLVLVGIFDGNPGKQIVRLERGDP